MFYVEKYHSDECYMAGEMSSCKVFTDYYKALEYFNKKGKEYKKGFLILSQDDEYGGYGGTEIIKEIACGTI